MILQSLNLFYISDDVMKTFGTKVLSNFFKMFGSWQVIYFKMF